MKKATKIGVLCALLYFSGSSFGVQGASLKKVVSPRAGNNRLAQAKAAPEKPTEQVLAQAGCVIPVDGSQGSCNISP